MDLHEQPHPALRRGRTPLAILIGLSLAALVATKFRAAPATHDPTPAFRPDPERAGSYLVRPDVQPALRTHVAELACRPGGNAPDGERACVRRLTVPVDAVRGTPEAPRLVVRTSPASIEPRRVQLGEVFDSLVEVLDGLQAGERVVVASGDVTPPE